MLKAIFVSIFLSASAIAQNAQQIAVSGYTQTAIRDYTMARESARALQLSIEKFLANPSAETQAEAKARWVEARDVYSPTEAYRFYGGPIDGENGPEGLINAWPLDEAYIDYVVGAPNAGIINSVAAYPEITRELLVSLNENGGEKNISTGFHAIEFLLWGQDLNANGAGRRSFKDYVVGQGKNAERRAQYLRVIAGLLVEHIEQVRSEWERVYAAEFTKSENTAESLKKLLTGAYRMAAEELSHERMFVAYDTQQQEDEHSCFSDTTHMDIINNFLGIERVVQGSGNNGPLALVASVDQAASKNLEQLLLKTKAAVYAIPAPFDRAIYSDDGREKILAAVTALEDLAVEIKNSAGVLGIALE